MRAPAMGRPWEARRLLAVLAVVALTAGMVLLYGGIALAGDEVPTKGPVPNHCVKFDFGTEAEGTTKSPRDYPNVEITLDRWYDSKKDPHSIDFTIAGLETGQYVKATTKSGSQPLEGWGPFTNGSFTIHSDLKWAISHVTFCVFDCGTTTTTVPEDTTTTTVEDTTTTTVEDTTTTTVEDTTTTTVEDTTTTTVEDTTTTTVEDTTTTTVEDTTTTTAEEATTTTVEEATTTTEDTEVLPTVVTTTPDEVDDDELPFTGMDTDVMIGLAVVLLGVGVTVLAMTRKAAEK